MSAWFGKSAAPEPPASAAEWWARNCDRAMTKTSRRRYVRQAPGGVTGWARVAVVAAGLAVLAVGCAGLWR